MNAKKCFMCKLTSNELGAPFAYESTCSKPCHDAFIEWTIATYGESKIVVDAKTGTRYRVPTRDIAERGLTYEDLPRYPVIE